MNVIPATYDDVPALRLLYRRLVEEQRAAFDLRYPVLDAEELDRFTIAVAGRIGQDDTFLAFLAVAPDGHPAGFLAGTLAQRAIGKPHLFGAPHWLYVLPEYRGQGVARQLVVVGVAAIEARGIHDVELTALADDPQWKARGWQPVTTNYHATTAAIATILAAPREVAPAAETAAPAAPPAEALPGGDVAAPATPRRRRKAKRRRPRMNGHAPLTAEP